MSASPIHAGASVVIALLAVCVGCGTHTRAHVPSPPARIGTTQTGIASWYGNPYNGRRTASGEIFDMEQLTAAHRTFPFNTWLEVTNLTNGKQVEVRVTDRGPFIKGRVIDLSLRAARDIDMVREGVVRVRIKVIAPPLIVTPVSANSANSRKAPAQPVIGPRSEPAIPRDAGSGPSSTKSTSPNPESGSPAAESSPAQGSPIQ